MAKCDLCKKERTGLRKCVKCGTVFCHWCAMDKDLDTQGNVIEIQEFCPKCKGHKFIEIIP